MDSAPKQECHKEDVRVQIHYFPERRQSTKGVTFLCFQMLLRNINIIILARGPKGQEFGEIQ